MKKILTIFLFFIAISLKAQFAWYGSYPIGETQVRINSYVATYAYCYYDFNCEVINSEGVTERGICSSEFSNPTTSNNKISYENGGGTYTAHPNLLESETKYYVRAYVIIPSGTIYSEQIELTTNTGIVVSGELITLESTSTSIYYSIIDNNNIISKKELIYYPKSNPSNYTIIQINNGDFSGTVNITGLTASTEYEYYIGAYLYNDCGYKTSPFYTFTTPSASSPPTVTTKDVLYASSSTASTGGNVVSNGGATVTARGVCWNTTGNPTTANNKTTDGSGNGDFSSTITGWTSGTTYYVRAYATNINGTSYGEEKTYSGAQLPNVSTYATYNGTPTSTYVACVINSIGSAALSDKGVVYSSFTQTPTLYDSFVSNGSGGTAGQGYSSYMSGLTPGTRYWIRPYATNVVGTYYGNKTYYDAPTGGCELATLSTTGITSITDLTAISGGNISSDGGCAVTARGVCWNTSGSPTTSDSHTSDGTGTGSFTSSLTGLNAATTYYVRAYATNTAGTAYGQQLLVQTTSRCNTPSLATAAVTNDDIIAGGAYFTGTISGSNNCSIDSCGFVWSTSINPTIESHSGGGMCYYASSATTDFTYACLVTCGYTYYVRAVIHSNGTHVYGDNQTFTEGTLTLPSNTVTLYYYLSTSNCTSKGNFQGSFEAACQALRDYNNPSCLDKYLAGVTFYYSPTGGTYVQGTQLYTVDKCKSGYGGYMLNLSNGDIINMANNGIIQSIQTCPK